ncbi:MAG: hypothetical protein ACYCV4_06160 [Dermatophilaceae bacterium]
MDIRQVDVFDDTELERLHEVTERAKAFERPHHSSWSLDEAKLELRRQDPGDRTPPSGPRRGRHTTRGPSSVARRCGSR